MEHHQSPGAFIAIREIHQLFERWRAASQRKDLDASMDPISPNIVSYEHEAPLRFTDLDDIRDQCRLGFERAEGALDWSVPDLQVRAAGDLAVSWGLNRVSTVIDGDETVTWSRGTRVFERVDGEWSMIHQHVSFPIDAETGAAATGLQP